MTKMLIRVPSSMPASERDELIRFASQFLDFPRGNVVMVLNDECAVTLVPTGDPIDEIIIAQCVTCREGREQ